MGNSISSHLEDSDTVTVNKARSDAIDRQLEEDSRMLRKERRILLLGLGRSGKSTIIKQIKIIHHGGFTDDELMAYRSATYRNTLDSAQAIVLAMRKLGLDCVDPSNRVNAENIFDFRIDPSPDFIFSSEIAEAIHQLWHDPIIRKLMDHHSSEFYLMDSAVHFFSHVRRIGSPSYRPTAEDVLRTPGCLKSTVITETRFMMDQFQINVIDVSGQHSERKKWIHHFEGPEGIIFCSSLGEYDRVVLEGTNQTRMAESLMLFESVVNSRWFSRTSIILLLNKIDIFKTKLPKAPLERYFPEYSGGADINKAAKYILWRFLKANYARLTVYPHLMQATGTSDVRLVLTGLVREILRKAQNTSGIL